MQENVTESKTTDTPNYYAIIPASVRYCKSIPPRAVLLYGEISALCNQEGYCWASNDYFAKLYGITDRSIRSLISALEEQGFISVELVTHEKYSNRKIYLAEAVVKFPGRKKTSATPEENFRDPGRKLPPNITLNITENKEYTDDDSFDSELAEGFVEETKPRTPDKLDDSPNHLKEIFAFVKKKHRELSDKLGWSDNQYKAATNWPLAMRRLKALASHDKVWFEALLRAAFRDKFCRDEIKYALDKILSDGVVGKLGGEIEKISKEITRPTGGFADETERLIYEAMMKDPGYQADMKRIDELFGRRNNEP